MRALHQVERLGSYGLVVPLSLAAVLVACGGDDGSGGSAAPIAYETVSGKVIDGYVADALVCLDLPASGACDPHDIQARSDTTGSYALRVPKGLTGPLIAEVTAGRSFTVVFDQVLTDTARFADVVLPATTFLERREIHRGYGAYALQDREAVVPPVGEARSNHEVFAELGRRTGIAAEGDPESAEQLAAAIYASSARGGEIQATLARTGIAQPASGTSPLQFVDVFPGTDDRNIHLVPEELDRETPQGLYVFQEEPSGGPLVLISPSTEKRVSSTLVQLHRGSVPVEVHPDDALPRGIKDGDDNIIPIPKVDVEQNTH